VVRPREIQNRYSVRLNGYLYRLPTGAPGFFRGSKDKSYGYTIIDHQNKTVLKGCEVLKLKELLQFQPKAERLHRMDEFIDAMLEDNPDLTTRELNRMLRRQFGTHISKGRIAYGDEFIDLQDYQVDTLRDNDRREWMKEHPLEQTHAAHHRDNEIQHQRSNSPHLRKPANIQGGSHDQNREWEVGHNSRYNDIDDERQLKR
jgi:predicted SAM-dependent methyltransferase